MKISARQSGPFLNGNGAPAKLVRRVETALEAGLPPRLEGRFKDHRDITGRRAEAGDLRVKPRPEPQSKRGGHR